MRPLNHLKAAQHHYPSIGKRVNQYYMANGQDLPAWPDWCFLPMAAWYAIVSEENKTERLPPHLIADVSRLAAIGTWRYTQGIYQFDSDILSALFESTVKGVLPSEVLLRLPEFSVYLETPGQRWLGALLHGFWAHLEWDVNHRRSELRLLLDCEQGLIPVPIHLGAWTLTEAVDRAASHAVLQAQAIDLDLPRNSSAVQQIAADINPLVSALLYLCSEAPEVDPLQAQGHWPARPRRKKTKGAVKLFPPDKPKLWAVGQVSGTALREAGYGMESGRTTRSHLRRGHWHGYWVGPKSAQKFEYRWLSPMLVAGHRDDEQESDE